MKTRATSVLLKTIPLALALGAGAMATDTVVKENTKNKKARAYVERTDNQRYFELIKQERKMKIVDWQMEAEKVQNALKIDSIAKITYALGVNAVKDSLVKANKK